MAATVEWKAFHYLRLAVLLLKVPSVRRLYGLFADHLGRVGDLGALVLREKDFAEGALAQLAHHFVLTQTLLKALQVQDGIKHVLPARLCFKVDDWRAQLRFPSLLLLGVAYEFQAVKLFASFFGLNQFVKGLGWSDATLQVIKLEREPICCILWCEVVAWWLMRRLWNQLDAFLAKPHLKLFQSCVFVDDEASWKIHLPSFLAHRLDFAVDLDRVDDLNKV